MSYDEDDLLPISALQHLLFCERQAALIHVEGQWQDNSRTLQGTHLHKQVDGGTRRREVRGDLVIVRGLALRSRRLGLVGRADVVEFHLAAPQGSSAESEERMTTSLHGLNGAWRPVPVEYKRGKPKSNRCDEVQLCAQALCLEEQLSLVIREGFLFYGKRQRRTPVAFDEELRSLTERAAQRFRDMVRLGETPRAERTPICESCSLVSLCLPEALSSHSVEDYLRTALDAPDSPQGGSP